MWGKRMGIGLKAWQIGAIIFVGFYLFWFEVLGKYYLQDLILHPIGWILIIPIICLSAILKLPIGQSSTFILYGIFVWGIIGSIIGYFIDYHLIIFGPKKEIVK